MPNLEKKLYSQELGLETTESDRPSDLEVVDRGDLAAYSFA